MSEENWQPSASLRNLRRRAEIIQAIRSFFISREYLEVETPIMSEFGVTDLYLENMQTSFRQRPYYLQTSPEYAMKRLLAAGSGPIFQLFRAFRDDELGRWHNPEFSLLEWYKLDVDHHGLMDEVEALLCSVLPVTSMERISYQQLFLKHCQIDPLLATVDELKQWLSSNHLLSPSFVDETDKDQFLFYLLIECIEPQLASSSTPIAIYDFPSSQAALAKVTGNVGHRFEVYFKGVELANGFYELSDAKEQRLRFEHDNDLRLEKGLNSKPLDNRFLAALQQGLPHCSGVAMGIDRLIALALGVNSIQDVMAFPVNRA